MKRIRVHVVAYRDCKNLVLRYTDPITGKSIRRTKYRDPQTGEETETGTNRKLARKLAAVWEADLNAGRDQGPGAIGWAQFRFRYEEEVAPSLATKTAQKIRVVFNHVERFLPKVAAGRLCDLTAEALSRLQAEWRGAGRSEFTIAGNLSHLKAALNWAVGQGLLTAAPKIKRPKRATSGKRKMKGRAISGEEFDRMLAAVPVALGEWRKRRRHIARAAARRKGLKRHRTNTDAIPVEIAPAAVESWRHYLRGLWLSGLRLEESLALSWDRDDRPRIDLSDEFPMLRIPAEAQKADRDTLTAIMPDFAAFLLATPPSERRGPVFRPLMGNGVARSDQAGKMLGLIGEVAGVKVCTHPQTGKIKYASAHDLRRAFGTRWARVLSASELQELMRHADFHTTQAYYIDQRASDVARSVWRKAEADLGTVSGTVADECDWKQSPAENATSKRTTS